MAKLFQGKQTKAEEMAEAKALKSGKITKEEYVKGELAEGKGDTKAAAMKKADALKTGKMSAQEYAAPKKMADGGMACGHRSAQDYGKK
jgi:hypothetical protein